MASGLMAVRVSSTPGEYLMWFRPERIRTVTWGGDPMKPVLVGDDPATLSPRRSFAQWHQLVEATSEAWSPADLTAARLVGDTIGDVILQFRSVRTLIAQDQLDQVRGQVKQSESPVVIADANGRILVTNEAFDAMLRAVQPKLDRVDDLSPLFVDPPFVRRALQELVKHQRTWRGEVRLRTQGKEPRPLVVRADPVLAPPQRVLGYVLLFTDVSERKAAEAARRRFQQGIIQRHAGMTVRLDSQDDLAFQNLLSSVVENAQLAALEITDGVDTARIPDLLDSVRASVTRAAEILEHLVWHAGQASESEG
jgi:PAS domain-containing protein